MRRRPSKRARALSSVPRAVRGEHQGSVSTEDIFALMQSRLMNGDVPAFTTPYLNLNVSAELPTLESM